MGGDSAVGGILKNFVGIFVLAVAGGLAAGIGVGADSAFADSIDDGEEIIQADRLGPQELWKLFTGNSEVGERFTKSWAGWKTYYDPDGRARRVSSAGDKLAGIWFVDPVGRHCMRWDGRTRTRCDEIVREGDAYVRLRNGEPHARIEIKAGNPFQL